MPNLRKLSAIFGTLAFLAMAHGLAAQGQEPRPTIEARSADIVPILDGDVLSDPGWAGTDVASGFTQTEPFPGQPATEKTEVRVLTTDSHLYIGAVMYDSNPNRSQTSDSRRDSDLSGEDSFLVVLDTFNDKSNGFIFGTNLAGIQYDGQLTNEGRGGSRRGGAGGFNLNWDTSWEVKVISADFGWSAEMKIPFSSLRYGAQGGNWGVNFMRIIARRNESSFWAALDPQYNLFRVSEAGSLSGIHPPKQRNLQLIPYALVSAKQSPTVEIPNPPQEDNAEVGIDLKYSITPSLTLDFTVNTDFAQVEADDQQVNLDRFSLFFPEKRPFFLENAGYFSVGSTGSIDMFFSRRIGLDGGEVIPILAGARVSGKAGGLSIGVLNMQTDALGEKSANNWGVARLSRDFANRSRIGGIVTSRVGTGDLATEDDYNQTIAFDGQMGIGRYTDVSGFVAKSETPGLDGRDHAFSLLGTYGSSNWRWRTEYAEVGEDFNPEVGFLARDDYRRVSGFVQRTYRPANMGQVKEIRPRIFSSNYFDFENFHETGFTSFGGDIEWISGFRVGGRIDHNLEGLQDPFVIFDGITIAPGTYSGPKAELSMNTSRSKSMSGFVQVEYGDFFDGKKASTDLAFSLRMGDYLTSELGWSYNDVSLLGGDFETNLGRLRITYTFTTSLLLQALIQYNDTTEDISTNLRFSWLKRSNTGLFVVYNEVQEYGSFVLPVPNRSLIIKYNRIFDVLR